MKGFVRPVLFIVAGALAGLGYYYLFGCSGSCAIRSSPWVTMAYMGVIGGLLSQATKRRRYPECNM